MISLQDNIIVDANFFIALGYPEDSHNIKAKKIFTEILSFKPLFITNQYLVAEALTVILIRSKQIDLVEKIKKDVFEEYNDIIHIHYFNDKVDSDIYELFIKQKKYKSEFLSFADCSLVVQARKQKIKTIFSFDNTFRQFSKEFKIIGV